jgi:membrane protease YdiL (CAAX protease family)
LTLPLAAIILGGAIYYLLFPDRFDLSMPFGRERGLIPPHLATEPWTVVVSWTILDAYRFLPITLFLMLGEEFGWRAYLLPKLMPLGPHKAVLLVGAIWAVFHWPVIFMGYNYGFGYWGAPVAGPLLSMLALGFPSAFYAWVTLRTGSVWPAAIGHGVNNGVGPLMVLFLRGDLNRLIGPGTWGIVGCLGYALLALPIFLSSRALAPVATAVSKKSRAVEIAADQAKLGSVS